MLVGYSMGGAMVAEFMGRSALADSVAGVVLDSPVLDWSAVVALGARKEGGLASSLAPLARQIVSLRGRGSSGRGRRCSCSMAPPT